MSVTVQVGVGGPVLLVRTSDLSLLVSLLVDKLSHTAMACSTHCNAIRCQRHSSEATGSHPVVSFKVLLTTIGRNRNLGTVELACSLPAISLRTACSTSAGDGRMVISGWAGHGQCTHSILIKQEGMPPSSMVLLAYLYYSRPQIICHETLPLATSCGATKDTPILELLLVSPPRSYLPPRRRYGASLHS